MVLILLFVVALVAWSLHLMQEAINHKEFSLMLAGFLVATAAAAMMAVYFLMGDYMGYITHLPEHAYSLHPPSPVWVVQESLIGTGVELVEQDQLQAQVLQAIATFQ